MELPFLHKHTNTGTHSLPDHIIRPHKKYLDFPCTSLAVGANLLESLLHLSCWVILYSQWIDSMARCFYWLHLKSRPLKLNNRWTPHLVWSERWSRIFLSWFSEKHIQLAHALLRLRKAIPTTWKLPEKNQWSSKLGLWTSTGFWKLKLFNFQFQWRCGGGGEN